MLFSLFSLRPKIHPAFIMNSYVDYQLIQSQIIDRVHIIIHLFICRVSGSTKKPPLWALLGSHNLLGQCRIISRQERADVRSDFWQWENSSVASVSSPRCGRGHRACLPDCSLHLYSRPVYLSKEEGRNQSSTAASASSTLPVFQSPIYWLRQH